VEKQKEGSTIEKLSSFPLLNLERLGSWDRKIDVEKREFPESKERSLVEPPMRHPSKNFD